MVDCATTTHLGPFCPQLAHLVGTLYKLAYISLLGDFAFILDPDLSLLLVLGSQRYRAQTCGEPPSKVYDTSGQW